MHFKQPSAKQSLAQVVAASSFFAYKLHIIPEKHYLKALRLCTEWLLDGKDKIIVVHYQDYIRVPANVRRFVALDICEMIIAINQDSPNLKTSLEAASCADIVVYPTSSMAAVFKAGGKELMIAPYGGDKSAYRQTPHRAGLASAIRDQPVKNTFLICARANTSRKGLDILLDALLLLSVRLGNSSFTSIDVRICGSVAPGKDDELLKHAVKALEVQSRISVSANQYPQDAYIDLVSSCDLFVMPSRLEGSSPAALEALWHGVPCILSRECGIDAFVDGKHGIQLDSLTSACLSDALYELISKPQGLLEARACLGKDQDLFSWKNYFEAYKNILSNVGVPY